MKQHKFFMVVILLSSALFASAQDSLNVQRLGQLSSGDGFAWKVAVAGDYAYVANENNLKIIDISDPYAPSETGSLGLSAAYSVAVSGSYAYVGCWYHLRVIDISNPAVPLEVGSCSIFGGPVRGLAVDGDYAYAGGLGLRVIDITNPAAPSEVGFCPTPNEIRGVAVSGNFAYVAAMTSGLRVIDITDPAAPFEVGYYDTPGSAYGVAVAGNYAYVADYTSGLRVVDITNPAAPLEVAFYGMQGARNVAVAGKYAYIADPLYGLHVLDVSDPTVPIEVGYYDTPGSPEGVATDCELVYLADYYYLGIYEFEPCTEVIPLAPQVVVQPEGQSARLTWDPVDETTCGCTVDVTHYLVFYSPTSEGEYYYHGFTTDTTYVHTGVIQYAEGMYYHVFATTAEVPALRELPTGGVMTQDEVLARLKK
ncbi:hypothetical protein KKH27_02365 [bacterium]|nr:hypothetical protein [bacterium]MBU1984657.1 hypothetical protein [bacterium]